VRLAVFTNQFPAPVSTFFARDMRGLLESGIEIDIFPLRPLDPSLWRYVPDILSERVFPRHKVHSLNFNRSLVDLLMPSTMWKFGPFLRDAAAICASAVRFGLEPLAKSVCVLVQGRSLVNRHFSENQYDHILAYWGNYAGTCAYVFHRLLGQPIPFSIFLHAGTDLYRDQVYLRQKLLYADNIIVVCEFNKEFIRELYPDIFPLLRQKIYLHHLGLDLREFYFESDGRLPQKIVGVGRHSKLKGFDYLLRATHQVLSRGRDVHLELVGEGEETESLRELAIELGITKNVTFLGWLLPDDVKQAIKTATILVHPSIDLGDAVPTVIKEAMALGTPVIASNLAGIPELLGNGKYGLLVPPKNINALAKGIERLIEDNELRVHFAEKAREFAEEKFDLWKNGKRLADLLYATRRRNGEEI